MGSAPHGQTALLFLTLLVLRPQDVKRILITANPKTFHLTNQHRIKTQNRISVNLWPRKGTTCTGKDQYNWLILSSHRLSSSATFCSCDRSASHRDSKPVGRGLELNRAPPLSLSAPLARKLSTSQMPSRTPNPSLQSLPCTVTMKCSFLALPHKLLERNQSCY